MTTESRTEQPDPQMVPLYFTEFVRENARQHAELMQEMYRLHAEAMGRITEVSERVSVTNTRVDGVQRSLESRIGGVQRSLEFTNRLLLAVLGTMGATFAGLVYTFLTQ